MKDDSQAIFALIRGELEKRIDGCECGGRGIVNQCATCDTKEVYGGHIPCDCNTSIITVPCPTCTPWREMVKELCWHEVVNEEKNEGISTCSCGYRQYDYYVGRHLGSYHGETSINPDLTTAMSGSRLLIVDLMDRAGMWEGFVEWHTLNTFWFLGSGVNIMQKNFKVIWEAHAKILTDGIYLVPAIRGYLEERENNQ